MAMPVTPTGLNGYTRRSSRLTFSASTMARSARSAVSTESRLWQPHISRMTCRPIAFMGSPPPQDNGRDSAANPFDLVLDRANDDLFEAQPASGKAFVDHLAYGRLDLAARGAMRLVNHPVGPFGNADADRGGNGLARARRYVDGVDGRYQGARCDLGRLAQDQGVLRQHAAHADQIEIADLRRQQRVVE